GRGGTARGGGGGGGGPAEIVSRPGTEYVARLAGLNLYRGRAGEGGRVDVEGGGTLAVDEPVEGDVFVAFPPSAVAVFSTRPEGGPRNVWEVGVAGLEPRGEHVRVQFPGRPPGAAEVAAPAAAQRGL